VGVPDRSPYRRSCGIDAYKVGFKVLPPAFWFSCAQLEEFWLNPNCAQSFRRKFNVSVFVKTSNGVDLSQHALEKFLGAQFVPDARCKGYFRNPNNSDLIPKPEFSFAHIHPTVEVLSQVWARSRLVSKSEKGRPFYNVFGPVPIWMISAFIHGTGRTQFRTSAADCTLSESTITLEPFRAALSSLHPGAD